MTQPSKTWAIDPNTKRISGTTDGLDAVLQAAWLLLLTPRYRHLIYTWSYGSELHTLIGTDTDYAYSEAKRMIREALMTDSRITAVRAFTRREGSLSFVIDTIYGSKDMDMEVDARARL